MGNYVVYKHTSPSGKVYIGITGKTPEERWRDGRGYSHNSLFARAIKKYGWENISHEILAENLSAEKAKELECYFISQYRATERDYGYNLTDGGDGISGRKRTSEEKSHMRSVMLAAWQDPDYRQKQTASLQELGKHHKERGTLRAVWAENLQNPEFREHISNTRKEMWRDPDMRAKILAARAEANSRPEVIEKRKRVNVGRKATPEVIEKMRVAQTKRSGVAVIQIDKETGETINRYSSLHEASRHTGLLVNSIYVCCRGKRKTAGGFRWEYEEGERKVV